jgi:hypothetical protein
MEGEKDIWRLISQVLATEKLCNIVTVGSLMGLTYEDRDFHDYMIFLKHQLKEGDVMLSECQLLAVPAFYFCNMARKGINMSAQISNVITKLIQLDGMARIKGIEAVYNCVIFGGLHNMKMVMTSGIAHHLMEIAAGDESAMLCCESDLPATIYVLFQEDSFKDALVRMGIATALKKYLCHQCHGPARQYAMKCAAVLSGHPVYHSELVTGGFLQAMLEAYPFEIWDVDCLLHMTTILWNLIKTVSNVNIRREAFTVICKLLHCEDAMSIMCEVFEYKSFCIIVEHLDYEVTTSLKAFLDRLREGTKKPPERKHPRCSSVVEEHCGTTEFVQNALKHLQVRTELRMTSLEHRVNLRLNQLEASFDRKLQNFSTMRSVKSLDHNKSSERFEKSAHSLKMDVLSLVSQMELKKR